MTGNRVLPWTALCVGSQTRAHRTSSVDRTSGAHLDPGAGATVDGGDMSVFSVKWGSMPRNVPN